MYALDKNGNVYSWGQNNVGQLGQNNTTSCYIPKMVSGVGGVGYLENIVEIQAGVQHVIAIDKYGQVYAWGTNASGQLGDFSTTQRNAPVVVPTARTYKIYAGNSQSFFQKYQGQVFGTGLNTTAMLGDTIATNRTSTVRTKGLDGISTLKNVKDIAVGGSATHFLLESGTVCAVRN